MKSVVTLHFLPYYFVHFAVPACHLRSDVAVARLACQAVALSEVEGAKVGPGVVHRAKTEG